MLPSTHSRQSKRSSAWCWRGFKKRYVPLGRVMQTSAFFSVFSFVLRFNLFASCCPTWWCMLVVKYFYPYRDEHAWESSDWLVCMHAAPRLRLFQCRVLRKCTRPEQIFRRYSPLTGSRHLGCNSSYCNVFQFLASLTNSSCKWHTSCMKALDPLWVTFA
jgi:hypothetical protein